MTPSDDPMLSRQDLQARLGYRFNAPALLTRALCHSSYVNEQSEAGVASNERLEFLGDAVLNLAVSHLLMKRHPHLSEGELSRHRSTMVNETQLAATARAIGMGLFLLLGKGEALSDGREKNSILADAIEAVIAAIYLDGGFDAALQFVERQFRQPIELANGHPGETDFKSRLQELVQPTCHEVPRYQVVETTGPDHDKRFRVRMTVAGIAAEGVGKNKKIAEQAAARAGLERLDRST